MNSAENRLPPGTDYDIHPAVAAMLKQLVALPHGIRVSVMRSWFKNSGGCDPIEIFSQFIGLANSVVANNRECAELLGVMNGELFPGKEHNINLPTIFGALMGIDLAVRSDAENPCQGCAFRVGSAANQSPSTTSDALWCTDTDDRFYCHEEFDDEGHPTRKCAGFEKLMANEATTA